MGNERPWDYNKWDGECNSDGYIFLINILLYSFNYKMNYILESVKKGNFCLKKNKVQRTN